MCPRRSGTPRTRVRRPGTFPWWGSRLVSRVGLPRCEERDEVNLLCLAAAFVVKGGVPGDGRHLVVVMTPVCERFCPRAAAEAPLALVHVILLHSEDRL